jgi:branched-chain amino acid transport system substrate-binding protein
VKKIFNILFVLAFALSLTPPAISAALLMQGVACEEDAVVQADDWLSKLADKFYGNVLAYPAVVEATNQAHAADDSYARIDNSDVIEPGWKLCIPSTDDAEALLAGRTSSAVASASGEPIVIGASLPLTGGFSVNGQKHKEGYELCVDLLNQAGGLLGRPVEIVVSDNRSDTEVAITQHERLINVDNADLLFGTFSSRLTFPVSAITEQNDMVYPIPSGAALRIYERGFDTLFYFQPQPAETVGNSPIELLLNRVAADELPTTAAIVHADDFFANSIANGLLGGEVEVNEGEVIELPSLLADAGIEVVYNEQWPEEGFADWITLANSINNSGAEFLIGLTASPEETVQLTRGLQTVGYQPKAVYLSQGTQLEYLEGVGEAANGVMIHSAWHPLATWEGVLAGQPFTNQDFIAAYEAKYGVAPDEDVAIPFALCQGMAQGVEGAGTTDNPAIAAWLHARTEADPVQTILGPFHWDEKGLPVGKPYLMTQWQNGELNFVYPLDEFEGVSDFIYPKPEW